MTADVTPASDAPAPPVDAARYRPSVRRLLALLIVASWIAWAVPAWQSTFHEVRVKEFMQDAGAKRIAGFVAVENVRQPLDGVRVGLDVSWLWGFQPQYDVPAASADGLPEEASLSQVIYTVDGERTHLVDLLVNGPDPYEALRASGAGPFTPATAPQSRDWAAIPGLLMLVLVIGSLIARPPRRGTRPFWVLVATLFAGLGVLAYAVSELAASRPSEAGPPRLRWTHGLGLAVIGGLLLPPLLGLLS